MEKQFVNYKIARILKEKGFKENCLAVYVNEKFQIPRGFGITFATYGMCEIVKTSILAPLWQQAIDWLREKHKIMIFFDFSIDNNNIEYSYKISEPKTWDECDIFVDDNFKIFEAAREAAIEKALELI